MGAEQVSEWAEPGENGGKNGTKELGGEEWMSDWQSGRPERERERVETGVWQVAETEGRLRGKKYNKYNKGQTSWVLWWKAPSQYYVFVTFNSIFKLTDVQYL